MRKVLEKLKLIQKKPAIVLVLLSLILLGGIGLLSIQKKPASTFKGEAFTRQAQIYTNFIGIKKCFEVEESQRQKCLDDYIVGYFGQKTIKEVLGDMESARVQDSQVENQCHPIAHAIGRLAYQYTGNVGDAFESCDQSCHSGCYHGVMERLFFNDQELNDANQHLTLKDLQNKIPGICNADKFRNPSNSVIFQCLHGVGHAILYSLDYNLRDSLKACDMLTTDYERQSCYGGVVMENVTAFDKKKRDLKREDPLYPCNSIEYKYQSTCYLMQTSIMLEYGMTVPEMAAECKNAENNVANCFISLGRDLSNYVRLNDSQRVVQACEVESIGYEDSCINGTIYALIDNTWDASFAYQYCNALQNEKNTNHCFASANNYLNWSYSKNRGNIQEECKKFAGKNSQKCISNISVS
jgi:hypothetical protein